MILQWYKRSERQYRVALFFSAASLAGAFGGILAWGIGHMRGVGGLKGWRYVSHLIMTTGDSESKAADPTAGGYSSSKASSPLSSARPRTGT